MYLQSHIYKNIPVSFDFMTTLNQGVFFVHPLLEIFILFHLKWHRISVYIIGPSSGYNTMKYYNICNFIILQFYTEYGYYCTE
jgi:hypothetical protein